MCGGGRRGRIPRLLKQEVLESPWKLRQNTADHQVIFPRISQAPVQKCAQNVHNIALLQGVAVLPCGNTDINKAAIQKPQTNEEGLMHVAETRKTNKSEVLYTPRIPLYKHCLYWPFKGSGGSGFISKIASLL